MTLACQLVFLQLYQMSRLSRKDRQYVLRSLMRLLECSLLNGLVLDDRREATNSQQGFDYLLGKFEVPR